MSRGTLFTGEYRPGGQIKGGHNSLGHREKLAVAMEVMCVSESESSKVCAELNSRGDPPPLGAAQGIYMSSTAQTSFSGTWMPTGTQLVSQNQSEEEEEADFGEYQEEKENVNSGYRVSMSRAKSSMFTAVYPIKAHQF